MVGGILSFSSFTFAHRILQAAPVNLNVLKEKMTKGEELKSSAAVNMVSIALQMSEPDARSQSAFQFSSFSFFTRDFSFVFPAPVLRLDSLHDDYLFLSK